MNILRLMKPCEVTKIIPVSVRTLGRWRKAGEGPDYFEFNGRVFYKSESVNQWIVNDGVKCNGN